MLPALADVRAVRLLADRVEIEVAHEVAEAGIVRAAGRPDLEPGRLPVGEGVGAVEALDLVKVGQEEGRVQGSGFRVARN